MVEIITGGSGFVGSHLATALLSQGKSVVLLDKLPPPENQKTLYQSYESLKYFRVDLSDRDNLPEKVLYACKNASTIWHLAANSDIQSGVGSIDVDLNDTLSTTITCIDLAKRLGIPRINFASSSAVYGDVGVQELRENCISSLPISNYGAAKLSSESFLAAAHESGFASINIFRFANVVGNIATHGVIYDFVKRLISNDEELVVLGNGAQAKRYIHVNDLVNAMQFIDKSINHGSLQCFNIAPKGNPTTVQQIAEFVVSQLNPKAKIVYGSGSKGWVGDIPVVLLNGDKLETAGWTPSLSSTEAMKKAAIEIITEANFSN